MVFVEVVNKNRVTVLAHPWCPNWGFRFYPAIRYSRWMRAGLVWGILLNLSVFNLPALDGEKEIVAEARAILDAYHADNPEPGNRKLHVIYWRPADRDYAAGYEHRIPRMLEHIQNFYAGEMERHGFGRRTIHFDRTGEGQIRIHLAKGDAPFSDYRKPEGQRVKKDCWPVLKEAGINPDKETVLIFTNLSDWDPETKVFRHKSPYYASGNHQRGTAWQLDSPELDTKNIPLTEPIIDDGEYGKISLGKHNSIFIGGIAHELGHALGLPHCRERRDEKEARGTALMGSGNRTYFDQLRNEGKGSFITLAHALRLASHPQFSGSVKGMNLPVAAEFSEMEVSPTDLSFALSGKVSAPVPVYAVVAYLDPEGGGDYDSKTHAAVPDEEGKFSIDCFATWPRQVGMVGEVRLIALMANGATSRWAGSYRIGENGKVDISLMETTLDLTEFSNAVRERDFAAAEALVSDLTRESTREVARSLLRAVKGEGKPVPEEKIAKDATVFPLSGLSPVSAAVGWQEPAYDFVPHPDSPILASGGRIFRTGIYAHAPARHRYETGGNWKTVTGFAGMPQRQGGSVVCVIRADGKEVFRSKTLKPNQAERFEIDVRGVAELELITEDAGDGNGGDWGFWFGVELGR